MADAAPRAGISATLSVALAAAADAIAGVKAGRALDEVLAGGTAQLSGPDRAAAQDIAYDACRRLNLLDALAARLLHKPNPALDTLARVALSELIDHPARAHAIVDQAVKAVATVRDGAFKGVLNAVLRRFLRERDALLAAAADTEAIRLGYPEWWIARVRKAWPHDWEEVLAQGNSRAPMMLRVNRRRVGVEDYLQALRRHGVEAIAAGGEAVLLARPQPVRSLPGFADGLVSVQDLGAQLAAPLLAPEPGMRVLDACAAPGGKTAHLLESCDCGVLALDRDAARLESVSTNLGRLGLKADLRAADAADLPSWWDGRPFDRVLLDAPCTASGVIRRHPDGKWLKRAGDLAGLARVQANLLDALWRTLRPGGKLLYATCSVFAEENQRQTASFLTSHPDAELLPIDLPASTPASPACTFIDVPAMRARNGQILPGPRHDGFFYACLAKAPG
jgi:16S rRNA (cytosine967-C5)-methyltransferase